MKKSGPGKVRLTIFVCNPCKHVNSNEVSRKESKLSIHSCGHPESNGRSLTSSNSKIIETPEWCPYFKK